MNLILLLSEDFIASHRVKLHGRRRDHILAVHQPDIGTSLAVGLINGDMGRGTVTAVDGQAIEMTVDFDSPPPPPLPVTLIVALPRPKMLKRILQTIAAMGVKSLYLLNSYRVEKSYWQSPVLDRKSIQENLILGLEQAKDTRLPQVELRKRFKPFVEDELPALIHRSRALVAHPNRGSLCPLRVREPITLAVGPEGGFIQYEVDKLIDCGFEAVHLGRRILRVETAIPALLAKLF
ncbi:16S rRNA (uracil(1498)-N(3))-methyltransferase [Exilibacterium tricleocarpae]|uniref:Ribosomal RNA small subunit methyltransferase E n=1 Tax=Exilibacterium tricleocarpae TaxID=2591008 RepID=A0A545U3S0_9GAMM|nr:16S rRNA (uracil(1498)-N(3))-methyltransferase [Exilibacterium tricleocarpae]TQV84119.1 16S rRNA (uracil(1498)-N(3))-methyltransferase [Exilibacterium tricleocarpae]